MHLARRCESGKQSAKMRPAVPTRRFHTVLCLAAVYLIWGSTYLVMRWGVHDFPPMFMGTIRFCLAGAILLAIARLRGEPLPSARAWGWSTAIGGLLFVGGNGFVAIAVTELSSATAAVVCASMPLWLALFATAGGEHTGKKQWLGMALGFVGVAILVGDGIRAADVGATVVLALAPILWAVGSLLSRRAPLRTGLAPAATQMIAGGVLMFVVGVIRGEHFAHAPSVTAVAALAYLIFFGSLVAFTAYAWLLQHTPPAVATSYAFVNPPIALVAGAAIGGESVGWPLLVATPVIVAAVVLVLSRRH
jgi:drug/metabolite transporter (DMT)-like permease